MPGQSVPLGFASLSLPEVSLHTQEVLSQAFPLFSLNRVFVSNLLFLTTNNDMHSWIHASTFIDTYGCELYVYTHIYGMYIFTVIIRL